MEERTDEMARVAEQQGVTNGARNALRMLEGVFEQIEQCGCADWVQ